MKKSTLSLLFLFLSFTGFSQFEGFEGATAPTVPTWTLGSGTWAVFDNGVQSTPPTYWATNPGIFPAHTGTVAAYMDIKNIGAGNSSEDYLASPIITVPANAQLKFWARTTINGNDNTTYRVMFAPAGSTQNNPLDYTTIAEFDETQLVTDPVNVVNNYDVWTEHIIDLSGFAGQDIYLAFVMVNTQPDISASGDRWLLDDINIVAQCFNPTTLPTTLITDTTATLNWTGTSAAYDVEVLLATANQGSGTFTNGVTTTTLPVTGLIANTCYKYYVRSVCSVGNTSGWAGPFNFCTTIAPVGCGGNYADSGGSGGNYANSENIPTLICAPAGELVTVNFTAFNTENNFDRLLVYDGNSAAATQIGNFTGNLTANLPTVTSSGNCLYFVFTSDGSVNGTGWVANITCAPAPTCSKPTTLTTSNVLATSATLTWTQPQNPNGTTAAQWQVIAVPCSTTIPAANDPLWTNATSPYNFTTLSASTCYDFYVRAICSATETSDPSVKVSATTQMLPPVCGGQFFDSGGIGANYANNENITTTICPAAGELVTVTFTAFNTENNFDRLRVFDGTGTGGTLLGNFTGNLAGNLPIVTSSSPGTCLTFVFTSDGSVTSTGWEANVTCAPAPTCTKPTNLTTSNVLATSATLSWTQPQNPNGTTATQWQVIAVPCSTTIPAANDPSWTNATSPYNFTTLSASTCYDFYVRAICSATETSDPSVKVSATTQMLPPVCGGQFFDSGGIGANYENNENITTTICPINAGDLVTVTFTAFNTENNFDRLRVFDGTGTGGTLLGNFTGNLAANLPIVTSSAPGTCLTFVFTSDGSVTSTGWAANVTCAPAPTCSKPTNLTTSNVLATSATLSWTQPQNPDGSTANTWQVIALDCGSPIPTATTPGWISANTNINFQMIGLTPDHCYDFYVMAICSPTDSSTPSIKATATTQITPPVCGGTFTDPGGANSNYANNSNVTTTICPTNPGDLVTVTFTSFNVGAGFDNDRLLVFDGNSTTAPQIGNFTGTAIPPAITASSADGCLTFLFTSDGFTNTAGWVADVTCAPPPTCRKPNALTASSITMTSATLGWTQLPNPDSSISSNWEVLVLPQGSPAPSTNSTGTPTNTTSYNSIGLIASTCYDFYVRSICSSTDSSPWAGPFNFCTLNPPPITTNDTQYTINQLVEDILFNSTCASITNLTSSTGNNYGSVNGIGYFDRNGSNFPFNNGVVMSSGSIASAPGPNTTTSSDGVDAWLGDTDLENIILAATGNAMNSHNASIIEFDFIPLVNNISFDFIFASEEYGTFQCTFSDAFAFLLTDNVTNVTTNLAVVPNTTTPISVVTIRDDQFNATCQSVNPQYFADYYQLPEGLNPNGSPTNFNGSTIPMTASSAVIPGHSYHIKLVVADRQDNVLDSAVFLEGGSFNFGLELGIDFLVSGGNALCPGTVNQLTSNLDPTLYSFTWFEGGIVIPNETGPNLLINHTGTYSLTAQLINTTCSATDTITVEYYDPIVLPTPNNMSRCNASGYAQFNLPQNNASVLGTLPPNAYTVTYYLTQADAESEVNILPNLYTNTTQFLQTIYARVENSAGCFAVSHFNLIVQDLTPQFTVTPNFAICNGSSGTISVTPTNFNPQDVTYSWTLNGNPLPFTTASINVGTAGTYSVVVNNSGCTANASTVLSVNTCDINIYASAIWMQNCNTLNDGEFFNTSGSGIDLINPTGGNFAVNFGVHLQNSSTLIMRGAEIKTQKTNSSNVCDARLNYRIFPSGNTPGSFTSWNLPFYSDCNTGNGTFINGGGPCASGQQKWQCVSQAGCNSPLDLTTLSPGNYTIQVYYDINGSFNTPNGCTDNLILNNGGNYFVANFTIQGSATITSINPITCNGNNGSITIGNLVPNQSYSVSYTDDSILVPPTSITANSNGEIILNGLNAGLYSNFTLLINGCTTVLTPSFTLVDPGLPIVSVNNPVICNGDTATVTATPQIPGNYNYVWTVPVGVTNPGNVASFTTNVVGDYTVVITPTNTLCNLDFENPTVTGQFPNMINVNQIPCWKTTSPDGIMEFWPSGTFENTFAYQGNQLIEMNGNSVATIYQDFNLIAGSSLSISFAHRGRFGDDTVRVEIGPVGGPYVNLGNFTDGNTAWVLHTLNYLVPTNNGNNYSLRFVSVSSAGNDPSVGNFLDAISVSSLECSSDPTTGTVSALPNATLSLTSANNLQTVCFNSAISDITYSTANTTNVTITGLPTGISGTYNTGIFTISGTSLQTGTFPYTISTVGGCGFVTLNGTITIDPLTTMELTSANNLQTVCFNNVISDITYSTANATNVTVSGLPTGISGTYNAGVFTISGTSLQTGDFPYIVSTVGGCGVVTLNGTITINPLTTMALTSANNLQTVCFNNAISDITYSTANATNVTVTGLPTGISGTYNAGVFTISGTSSQTGVFPYTISTVGGCGVVTLNGTITIDPLATMTLTSANNIQTVCFNTVISNITYSTTNATNVTVTGLPTGIIGTYNAGVFTISGISSQTGVFPYMVSTVGGCIPINLNGTITVTARKIPTFNSIPTICYGGTVPSLSNISVNNVNGTWLPATINNTSSGDYVFTPLASECASPVTVNITVENSFDFEINGECMNNNFMLQVVPINSSFDTNNVTYLWEYNNLPVGTSEMFDVVSYFNSTSVNEQIPAMFYATVTTANGCSIRKSHLVDRTYCDIQRGISPNNDGNNEFFDLSNMNVSMLSIYNRYGTKVYSKGNYTNEWTGKDLNDNDLPDGTYYYVIEFNNNQDAKTGWIYINREKK